VIEICPEGRAGISAARNVTIGAEGVELPGILTKLVPQDVEIAVIRSHLEAFITRPVPAIKDFRDLVTLSGKVSVR